MLVIAESHLAPHPHQIYTLHVLSVKSPSIILNMNISWGLDGSVIICTFFKKTGSFHSINTYQYSV
jgi:hypothetical protein